MFRNNRQVVLAMLIWLISVAPILNAHAEESLGISGSFAGMAFRMTPGEVMDHPEVDVILFNSGTSDLKVRLSAQGPIGVHFRFDQTQVTIPPQGSLRAPIVFELDPNCAIGTSELSVTASVIEGTGLSINGFATLKAKLVVMGEAGQVKIKTVDVRGQAMAAQLNLVRLTDQGQRLPLIQSDNGILQAKLVPGTYNVTARFLGFDLASQTFTLKDQDELELTLTLRSILFDHFLIGPRFDDQNRITLVSVDASFNNLSSPESQVSVVLNLFKDGQWIEKIQPLTLERLDTGRTQVNFNVIPSSPWQTGTYTFGLSLVSQDGIVLAQSPTRSLPVTVSGSFALMGWGGWGLALMLLLLAIRKKFQSKENASS